MKPFFIVLLLPLLAACSHEHPLTDPRTRRPAARPPEPPGPAVPLHHARLPAPRGARLPAVRASKTPLRGLHLFFRLPRNP